MQHDLRSGRDDVCVATPVSGSGCRSSRAKPRGLGAASYDDAALGARHRGMMGRTPDFLNTASWPWLRRETTSPRIVRLFKLNIQRYYEYIREHEPGPDPHSGEPAAQRSPQGSGSTTHGIACRW